MRKGNVWMNLTCEKCGREITADEGAFIYYEGKMLFACKACADEMNNEMKYGSKVSSAVDEKKKQAVYITENRDAFEEFLKKMEQVLQKIPAVGKQLTDVPLLVSLVKNYVTGKYREIPYNSIVAVIAALLYVASPVDILPDVIPAVGFADDAMAVGFCVKMIHDDLAKYKAWRDGEGAEGAEA